MTDKIENQSSLGVNKDTGLDMASTIDWYSQNIDTLLGMLPEPIDRQPRFSLEGEENFSISREELNSLIELFPESALRRSRLIGNIIIGKRTLFFDKKSKPGSPIPTENVNEAISPTAIIPSYTDNAKWQETGIPNSDIHLYRIPEVVPPDVQKIIHAEGLIHEIGHTILTPLYRGKEMPLKLPDGTIVDGKQFILDFGNASENHTPFSHYSSEYRDEEGKFKGKLGVEEEFCEAIAAYLLGFVYAKEEERRLNPFSDRPEIKVMVEAFLNAESVTIAA